MSDCSTRAWKIPEHREPGVLYDHGQPNYDYLQAHAIVVGGIRFDRVRECEIEYDEDEMDLILSSPEDTWGYKCNACEWTFRYDRGLKPDYCPHCGAKVVQR